MTDVEFAAQKELFAALAAAAKACEWVKKRSAPGVQYQYASAESIVSEADRVFELNGIAVIPGAVEVVTVGPREAGKAIMYAIVRKFTITHSGGGWIDGGGVAAIGANMGGTPPQAMNSTETMCYAYFVKTLLRMPRQSEEDAEHTSNNRPQGDEERRPPATPSVPMPTTRKATKILSTITKIATVDAYQGFLAKWTDAIAHRGAPLGDGGVDDCGYSDPDVMEVNRALAAARERVGIR